MGLKLKTASNGSVSLEPTNTASDYTLTVPAQTGTVAIDGPAFGVYQASNQNISTATVTKVQLQTEEFDTANCFDNTTNYRFTPTVAGYYQINAGVFYNLGVTALSCAIYIYKNGTAVRQSYGAGNNASGWFYVATNGLIYMNGTTDYLELYTYQSSGSTQPTNSGNTTFMNGYLARAA